MLLGADIGAIAEKTEKRRRGRLPKHRPMIDAHLEHVARAMFSAMSTWVRERVVRSRESSITAIITW